MVLSLSFVDDVAPQRVLRAFITKTMELIKFADTFVERTDEVARNPARRCSALRLGRVAKTKVDNVLIRASLDVETDVVNGELETLGAADESLLEDGLCVGENRLAPGEDQLLFYSVNLAFDRREELAGDLYEPLNVILQNAGLRRVFTLGDVMQVTDVVNHRRVKAPR
jgi:hypothetical protein